MIGICTLANDQVYDLAIALLNSIEVQLGQDFPVCIYPYDEQVTKLQAAIAERPQVSLYQDQASMTRWDTWVQQVWELHPTILSSEPSQGTERFHRFGTHRRFCAFDGPFEQFLYLDADTLLLGPIEPIFQALQEVDCVVYDFQHQDPSHVFNIQSPRLAQLFSSEQLQASIFCSGFFASHRHLFTNQELYAVLQSLAAGEIDILYPPAPDQTLLNYSLLKTGKAIANLALTLPPEKITGCCVTSRHFQEKDHKLYDHGKPLTYLHYIGLPIALFQVVCAGNNLTFPYRDLFLYYRYLREPENYPQFQEQPKPYQAELPWYQKIQQKLLNRG